MSPLRIVIVDDEPLARARLRRLLAMRDDCILVGEFADGVELAAGVAALHPDLILLDIAMPGPDGFVSLDMLIEPRPLVVFVTAFAGHAPRAFDSDAVDYLVKPVSGERLEQALRKTARRLRPLATPALQSGVSKTLRFVAKGRTYLIEASNIASVQARGNYVEIVTSAQTTLLRTSLQSVFGKLDDLDFLRVHRSWIVARSAISQITSLPGLRSEILLKDGRRVPGGRAFAASIGGGIIRSGRCAGSVEPPSNRGFL